jgi:hypothetical protein
LALTGQSTTARDRLGLRAAGIRTGMVRTLITLAPLNTSKFSQHHTSARNNGGERVQNNQEIQTAGFR